jgi:hypothetical protein
MWLCIQDWQANDFGYLQMEQSASIGVDPIVWASICHVSVGKRAASLVLDSACQGCPYRQVERDSDG